MAKASSDTHDSLERRTRATGGVDGFSRQSTRSVGASAAHPKSARSHTLMRHAVKKPTEVAPKIETRSTPVNASSNTGDFDFRPRSSLFTGADKDRADRAKHVNKSRLIRKFTDFTSNTVQSVQSAVKPTPMPVAKAPAEPAKPGTQPSQAIAPTPVKPGDKLASRGVAKATAPAKPAKKPRLHKRLARKFNTSTKVIGISAGVLAALILGAFFSYQNIPNFAMRVASARSGVHASFPGYQPSGFAMGGPVHYSSGVVTLNFKANADSRRKFTITQKSSDMNSDTLLNNYVASAGSMYQTYQDHGRTIYIYDNGNKATWVNEGVWYNIAGNSSLSGEQLVRIATSM